MGSVGEVDSQSSPPWFGPAHDRFCVSSLSRDHVSSAEPVTLCVYKRRASWPARGPGLAHVMVTDVAKTCRLDAAITSAVRTGD